MLEDSVGGGQVSLLYKMFVDKSPESSEDQPKSWRLDSQQEISEEEGFEVCLEAQAQTINTRLKLIQYNRMFKNI